MLKPNKNFRMSKTSKMRLANHIDPEMKAHVKRMLIQAQLAAEQQPAKKVGGRDE